MVETVERNSRPILKGGGSALRTLKHVDRILRQAGTEDRAVLSLHNILFGSFEGGTSDIIEDLLGFSGVVYPVASRSTCHAKSRRDLRDALERTPNIRAIALLLNVDSFGELHDLFPRMVDFLECPGNPTAHRTDPSRCDILQCRGCNMSLKISQGPKVMCGHCGCVLNVATDTKETSPSIVKSVRDSTLPLPSLVDSSSSQSKRAPSGEIQESFRAKCSICFGIVWVSPDALKVRCGVCYNVIEIPELSMAVSLTFSAASSSTEDFIGKRERDRLHVAAQKKLKERISAIPQYDDLSSLDKKGLEACGLSAPPQMSYDEDEHAFVVTFKLVNGLEETMTFPASPAGQKDPLAAADALTFQRRPSRKFEVQCLQSSVLPGPISHPSCLPDLRESFEHVACPSCNGGVQILSRFKYYICCFCKTQFETATARRVYDLDKYKERPSRARIADVNQRLNQSRTNPSDTESPVLPAGLPPSGIHASYQSQSSAAFTSETSVSMAQQSVAPTQDRLSPLTGNLSSTLASESPPIPETVGKTAQDSEMKEQAACGGAATGVSSRPSFSGADLLMEVDDDSNGTATEPDPDITVVNDVEMNEVGDGFEGRQSVKPETSGGEVDMASDNQSEDNKASLIADQKSVVGHEHQSEVAPPEGTMSEGADPDVMKAVASTTMELEPSPDDSVVKAVRDISVTEPSSEVSEVSVEPAPGVSCAPATEAPTSAGLDTESLVPAPEPTGSTPTLDGTAPEAATGALATTKTTGQAALGTTETTPTVPETPLDAKPFGPESPTTVGTTAATIMLASATLEAKTTDDVAPESTETVHPSEGSSATTADQQRPSVGDATAATMTPASTTPEAETPVAPEAVHLSEEPTETVHPSDVSTKGAGEPQPQYQQRPSVSDTTAVTITPASTTPEAEAPDSVVPETESTETVYPSDITSASATKGTAEPQLQRRPSVVQPELETSMNDPTTAPSAPLQVQQQPSAVQSEPAPLVTNAKAVELLASAESSTVETPSASLTEVDHDRSVGTVTDSAPVTEVQHLPEDHANSSSLGQKPLVPADNMIDARGAPDLNIDGVPRELNEQTTNSFVGDKLLDPPSSVLQRTEDRETSPEERLFVDGAGNLDRPSEGAENQLPSRTPEAFPTDGTVSLRNESRLSLDSAVTDDGATESVSDSDVVMVSPVRDSESPVVLNKPPRELPSAETHAELNAEVSFTHLHEHSRNSVLTSSDAAASELDVPDAPTAPEFTASPVRGAPSTATLQPADIQSQVSDVLVPATTGSEPVPTAPATSLVPDPSPTPGDVSATASAPGTIGDVLEDDPASVSRTIESEQMKANPPPSIPPTSPSSSSASSPPPPPGIDLETLRSLINRTGSTSNRNRPADSVTKTPEVIDLISDESSSVQYISDDSSGEEMSLNEEEIRPMVKQEPPQPHEEDIEDVSHMNPVDRVADNSPDEGNSGTPTEADGCTEITLSEGEVVGSDKEDGSSELALSEGEVVGSDREDAGNSAEFVDERGKSGPVEENDVASHAGATSKDGTEAHVREPVSSRSGERVGPDTGAEDYGGEPIAKQTGERVGGALNGDVDELASLNRSRSPTEGELPPREENRKEDGCDKLTTSDKQTSRDGCVRRFWAGFDLARSGKGVRPSDIFCDEEILVFEKMVSADSPHSTHSSHSQSGQPSLTPQEFYTAMPSRPDPALLDMWATEVGVSPFLALFASTQLRDDEDRWQKIRDMLGCGTTPDLLASLYNCLLTPTEKAIRVRSGDGGANGGGTEDAEADSAASTVARVRMGSSPTPSVVPESPPSKYPADLSPALEASMLEVSSTPKKPDPLQPCKRATGSSSTSLPARLDEGSHMASRDNRALFRKEDETVFAPRGVQEAKAGTSPDRSTLKRTRVENVLSTLQADVVGRTGVCKIGEEPESKRRKKLKLSRESDGAPVRDNASESSANNLGRNTKHAEETVGNRRQEESPAEPDAKRRKKQRSTEGAPTGRSATELGKSVDSQSHRRDSTHTEKSSKSAYRPRKIPRKSHESVTDAAQKPQGSNRVPTVAQKSADIAKGVITGSSTKRTSGTYPVQKKNVAATDRSSPVSRQASLSGRSKTNSPKKPRDYNPEHSHAPMEPKLSKSARRKLNKLKNRGSKSMSPTARISDLSASKASPPSPNPFLLRVKQRKSSGRASSEKDLRPRSTDTVRSPSRGPSRIEIVKEMLSDRSRDSNRIEISREKSDRSRDSNRIEFSKDKSDRSRESNRIEFSRDKSDRGRDSNRIEISREKLKSDRGSSFLSSLSSASRTWASPRTPSPQRRSRSPRSRRGSTSPSRGRGFGVRDRTDLSPDRRGRSVSPDAHPLSLDAPCSPPTRSPKVDYSPPHPTEHEGSSSNTVAGWSPPPQSRPSSRIVKPVRRRDEIREYSEYRVVERPRGSPPGPTFRMTPVFQRELSPERLSSEYHPQPDFPGPLRHEPFPERFHGFPHRVLHDGPRLEPVPPLHGDHPLNVPFGLRKHHVGPIPARFRNVAPPLPRIHEHMDRGSPYDRYPPHHHY